MSHTIEPHERAGFDQDAAKLDRLISLARAHRQTFCEMPGLPCISDQLIRLLHDASHHDLFVIGVLCIARLADLPAPPDPLEGIEL